MRRTIATFGFALALSAPLGAQAMSKPEKKPMSPMADSQHMAMSPSDSGKAAMKKGSEMKKGEMGAKKDGMGKMDHGGKDMAMPDSGMGKNKKMADKKDSSAMMMMKKPRD